MVKVGFMIMIDYCYLFIMGMLDTDSGQKQEKPEVPRRKWWSNIMVYHDSSWSYNHGKAWSFMFC